jgi:hypothetical protein
MVMMGHHSRPTELSKTILHETRKELIRPGQEKKDRTPPQGTKILV